MAKRLFIDRTKQNPFNYHWWAPMLFDKINVSIIRDLEIEIRPRNCGKTWERRQLRASSLGLVSVPSS